MSDMIWVYGKRVGRQEVVGRRLFLWLDADGGALQEDGIFKAKRSEVVWFDDTLCQ